jgi:ribonuclease-3
MELKPELKENLIKLEEIIGARFNDLKLLQAAIVHRSYPNEHPEENFSSNERLEFLGDAILEFLTSEFLYNKFPDEQEGILTIYRAALVKTDNLAGVARELKLNEYILMSRGEFALGNSSNVSILADLFEAILGAIYLDMGLEKCKVFLNKVVWFKIDEIVRENLHIDPKTKLQSESQLRLKITPSYEIISEIGKDHNKEFTAVAKLKNSVAGKGIGKSKQAAEQNAASDAIKNLKYDQKE